MDTIIKRLRACRHAFDAAAQTIGLEGRRQLALELESTMQAAGFWDDSQKAQAIAKRQSGLATAVEAWTSVDSDIKETMELAQLHDSSLLGDLEKQVSSIEDRLEALKHELRYSGKYDDHDAVITISAGAGGTDAQDWTQMLLRMYTRWAEQNDFALELIEESAGEEAGLKRATISVSGTYAYGKLRGEHGVHRLVRLSPFNSDSLRQTSFAKVDVLPKIDQPDELVIDAKELKVDVYRAGGHGGQSVNTTDSAVRVTHIPTGIAVAIQNERSQLQNKETAMTILRSKLVALQLEQHQEKVGELKGPNQSAEWGNQIRSYVLHPYKQVKDLRTRYETSDADGVLDGKLEPFINAYLEANLGQ